MKTRLLLSFGFLAVALLASGPMAVYAGQPSGIDVTMNIYSTVVDEQNLNVYYGVSGSCAGSSSSIDLSNLAGDTFLGPGTAYGFVPPWTLVSGLASSQYVPNSDCNSTTGVCLKVKISPNGRNLTIDTRGTQGPRAVSLNFGSPCTSCSIPGSTTPFGEALGSIIPTPALMTVFLDQSMTTMGVCSTTACPEAQAVFARLWFDDPNGDPNLVYRIDWAYMRLLRMSTNTWYVIADGCDGTRVASLYRLHNNQHKTTVSFRGSYLFPFFISAVR